MAIIMDWPNKIINVPRADLLLVQSVPTEIRELQIDSFRLELKSLEDDPTGMPYLDTHKHNTIVTLGGVTYARLIEIINGYTVTFEDGQYAVNLVGANSNIGDVVNVNQVSVRSANSAGLTYSKEIEDLSYVDGRVWIDSNDGVASTQYPAGTPARPVLNYDWAESLVELRGLPHRYRLRGTVTLVDDGDLEQADWEGSYPDNAFVILAGVGTEDYAFSKCNISGLCVGHFSARSCEFQDIIDFEGSAHDTGLGGTLTLPSGVSNILYNFHQCYSNVPGTGSPILDCNDATNLNIQFRAYAGGIRIMNFSSADNNMTIDMISGHAIIDATCTDGTIVIRGSGHITDESSGGVTIVDKGLSYAHVDKLLSKKEWIALH